jgi:hypothetical protein
VLSTTKACHATPRLHTQLGSNTPLRTNRTLRESHVQHKQPSARASVQDVPRFTLMIWALFICAAVWTLVVGFLALHMGTTSASFVETTNSRLDALAYWNAYGQVSIRYDHDSITGRRDWAAMLIQSIILAPFTLVLHAAEVLVHLSQDETVWRKTATIGSLVDESYLRDEWGNLEKRILFLFKAVIPWVFGNAFSCNLKVWMALLPFCALTLLCGLLVAFAEIVSRMKRSGTQPITYGNVMTLMYLVDEWHPRIFWGDRGEVSPGLRKAGTSNTRLADLNPKCCYIGLTA